VHFYRVYIAYYTELNLQIYNYVQTNNKFVAKIAHAPDENFVAIFAFVERLPTSATLAGSLLYCPNLTQ